MASCTNVCATGMGIEEACGTKPSGTNLVCGHNKININRGYNWRRAIADTAYNHNNRYNGVSLNRTLPHSVHVHQPPCGSRAGVGEELRDTPLLQAFVGERDHSPRGLAGLRPLEEQVGRAMGQEGPHPVPAVAGGQSLQQLHELVPPHPVIGDEPGHQLIIPLVAVHSHRGKRQAEPALNVEIQWLWTDGAAFRLSIEHQSNSKLQYQI